MKTVIKTLICIALAWFWIANASQSTPDTPEQARAKLLSFAHMAAAVFHAALCGDLPHVLMMVFGHSGRRIKQLRRRRRRILISVAFFLRSSGRVVLSIGKPPTTFTSTFELRKNAAARRPMEIKSPSRLCARCIMCPARQDERRQLRRPLKLTLCRC